MAVAKSLDELALTVCTCGAAFATEAEYLEHLGRVGPVHGRDAVRKVCAEANTGWQCLREPGHDGPCAAPPTEPLPCDLCEPVVTDGAWQARYELTISILRRLIETHDPKQHLFTKAQQAWADATAAVVESEGL